MRSRLKILLVIFCVGALLAVAFVPRHYPQRVWREAKRQWMILTGGMIDVGGYYVRIDCRGSGRTVVFDSGLNQSRDTWGIVPDEIAKVARVCTYDRPTVGESDDAGFTRTSSDAARELKTLLKKAGEKGPFILVGHSFGGLNAQVYRMIYPEDVFGLVLVEPSHPDQYKKIAESKQEPEREQYLRHEGGENGERLDLLSSAEQLKNSVGATAGPVIVLTAKSNPYSYLFDDVSVTGATSRSGGSILSAHIVVENSGHFLQLDRPDAVVSAVNKMLQYSERSEVTIETK